jgi:hypothetical protein
MDDYISDFDIDIGELVGEAINGENEAEETNENGSDDAVIVVEEQNNDYPAQGRDLDLSEPSSAYLRYFHYAKSDQWATCFTCGGKISRRNYGTTGMIGHLRRHHPTLFVQFSAAKNYSPVAKKSADYSAPTKNAAKRKPRESADDSAAGQLLRTAKQTTLTNLSSEPVVKWGRHSSDSKQLDDLILRYICLSLEPLSQAEKPGFSDFLEAACPRF